MKRNSFIRKDFSVDNSLHWQLGNWLLVTRYPPFHTYLGTFNICSALQKVPPFLLLLLLLCSASSLCSVPRLWGGIAEQDYCESYCLGPFYRRGACVPHTRQTAGRMLWMLGRSLFGDLRHRAGTNKDLVAPCPLL